MPTPVDVELVVTGIENLVEYLLQLKKNGQLDDTQLTALVTSKNTATRTMIAQFIAGATPPKP